jgi:hypothetical protein
MPEVRGRGIGDLLVHVHVEVPRTLSPRAEQLLRDLAAEEQAAVSPRRSSFFTRLAEYFQGKEAGAEAGKAQGERPVAPQGKPHGGRSEHTTDQKEKRA